MPVFIPLGDDLIGVFRAQRLIDLFVCVFRAGIEPLGRGSGDCLIIEKLNSAGTVFIAECAFCIINARINKAQQDSFAAQVQIRLLMYLHNPGHRQVRAVQQTHDKGDVADEAGSELVDQTVEGFRIRIADNIPSGKQLRG
ncbi:hypothetical protein SDC9_75804 [bioreactor metagenome]|uniref:Uncharacterized protein n=1 Tax=bioreactor metagenome TaxID=1076179 RepID=A0A644YT69_9ZZZZ